MDEELGTRSNGKRSGNKEGNSASFSFLIQMKVFNSFLVK